MQFDPIRAEVWRHLLASIAEEMGATLERTGYSPNITERRRHAPYGLAGGEPSATGCNSLHLPDGAERQLPAKFSGGCEAGTLITVATPGGGGWGHCPARRERK